MTHACLAWEFAADNNLLKLQRLQNKVLRTIGNFPKRTPVRDLHMAFKLPYIYDYIKNYPGAPRVRCYARTWCPSLTPFYLSSLTSMFTLRLL
jgi:hypothetical protein